MKNISSEKPEFKRIILWKGLFDNNHSKRIALANADNIERMR